MIAISELVSIKIPRVTILISVTLPPSPILSSNTTATKNNNAPILKYIDQAETEWKRNSAKHLV